MTRYYDYVLGLIPLALFGITALLSVYGIPLTTAVLIGAGVSALIIGHAIFVNVPVAAEPTHERAGPQNRRFNAD